MTFSPAHGDSGEEGGGRCSALWEVTHVEVRQRVVCVAIQGPICAVHVLVNHPRNKLRGEGDDKCLWRQVR